MVASLIYQKTLLKTLNKTGFQLNLYDTCVANLIVKFKQQTIWFHMENLKLSHKDSGVNNWFINTIRDEYKSVF